MNACRYCGRLVTKYYRHLSRHHGKEPDVTRLFDISYPDDPLRQRRERTAFASGLRAEGNRAHNRDCEDELFIPAKRARRSRPRLLASNTDECDWCHRSYARGSMRKHVRKCPRRPTPAAAAATTAPTTAAAAQPTPSAPEPTPAPRLSGRRLEVVNRMRLLLEPHIRRPEVLQTGLSDPTIAGMAARYVDGHRGRGDPVPTACQRVRDATALLLEVRRVNPAAFDFEEAVRPVNYESLVAAARRMAGFDPTTDEVAVTGMASRLLSVVREANYYRFDESVLDRSVTAERRDRIRIEHADFNSLLDHRWGTDIGNVSRATQEVRWNDNAGQRVPLDSDVRLFYTTLGDRAVVYRGRLEDFPTAGNYDLLAEVTIAELTAYNRKRAPDVPGARYSAWLGRETFGGSGRMYSRFVVRSKRLGRPANVTVPRHVEPSIRLLLRTRRLLGIPDPSGGLRAEDIGEPAEPGAGTDPAAEQQPRPDPLDAEYDDADDAADDEEEEAEEDEAAAEDGEESTPAANELLFARPGSARPYGATDIIRRLRRTMPMLRDPDNITATGLRRHFASKAAERRRGPPAEDLMDEQLDHTRGTDEQYYTSPFPSAEAALVVAERLRVAAETPEVIPGPSRVQQEAARTLRRSGALTIASVQRHQGRPSTEAPAVPPGPTARRAPATETSSINRRWTAEETEAAVALFPAHVREGRLPSRADVEALLRAGYGVAGRSAEAIRLRLWTVIRRGRRPN